MIPNKEERETCVDGVAEVDADGEGVPDCLDGAVDLCPDDPVKTEAGVCGCGRSDGGANDTGLPDCFDGAYHIESDTLYAFNGAYWASIDSSLPAGNLDSGSYLGVIEAEAYHWVYDAIDGSHQLCGFDGSSWTALDTNTPDGDVGGFLGMMSGSYIGNLY